MGFINKIKGVLSSDDRHNFTFLNGQLKNNPLELVLDSDIIFDSNDTEFSDKGIFLEYDDMVLDGNGHVIDAKNKSVIFYIKGENVTIKNVCFENALNVAVFNDAKNTRICDCTFENIEGQPIVNINGSLNVSNTSFLSNETSKSGGAIYNKKGNLELFNCQFNYNVSVGPGGALMNSEGTVKVNSCEFLNNISKDVGGAVYNLSELEIINSKFNHNTSRREGKSIYNNSGANLKVSGCDFSGLIRDELFGVTDFESQIVNSKFKDDEFNLENSSQWVKSQPTKNFTYLNDLIHSRKNEIVLDADILFDESEKADFPNGIEIHSNNLVIDGNGHFISGNNKSSIFFNSAKRVVLKNIVFKDVKSQDAVIVNWGEMDIQDSKFANNNGLLTGGAIINAGKGVLRIHNTEFSNNKSDRSGGAIVNYSKLSIENSKFENNTAKEEAGAIINLQECELDITNTQFINNVAGSYGSSILNLGTLNLDGSRFTGSREKEICVISTSVLNMENCNFNSEDNILLQTLGRKEENSLANFKYLNDLIQSGRKEIVLEIDFKLKDNESDYFSQGIEIDTGELTIDGKNHVIDANKKARIFNVYNGNVIFKNITFKNAVADSGAAVLNNWGNVDFINCKFENNSSTVQGGAVTNLEGSLKIDSSDFFNNDAVNAGGAVINAGNLEVSDCNFRNNGADLGGAVYNLATAVIVNSQFDTNMAKTDGGAINNYRQATLNVLNSYFVNNSSQHGGAIFNYNYAQIRESRFNNNEATKMGGAVMSIKTLKVYKVIFENNISKAVGAGVTHAGTFTEIISSRFIQNKASQTGGAVFCKDFDSSGLFYEDCGFIENFPNDIS